MKILKSILSLVIIIVIIITSAFTSSAISYNEIKKNPEFRYGVDVSVWNDDLDWEVLRKNGVEFAYIRIGYYNKSGGYLDKRFKQNVIGCVENGIEFGVYVYSYVYSITDNIACAKWIDKQLGKMGNYCKDKDTIQVAYDIEDSVQVNALAKGKIKKSYLQKSVETFCKKIKNYGYIPTVYSFSSFFDDYLDIVSLQDKGIKIWMARWPDLNTIDITKKNKINNCYPDVWQYGCTLKIAGTVFDTNVSYNNMYDYKNEDSQLTVDGLKNYYSYSGKQKKPAIQVYSGNKILTEDIDYKLVYFNNVNSGTARMKIIRYNSKGKYKETKTITYNIWDDKITDLKKSSTRNKINLRWNEVENADFYEIYFYDEYLGEYSLLEETELNYTKLSELDFDTKYKFKIRAVRQIDGETCYGKFINFSYRTKA